MYVPEHKHFKPRKFLKLAEDLIKDDDYEEPARARTAIGRAYYASHLFVRQKMQQAGWSIPDDHTVHDFVIDQLLDSEISHIGSMLDQLREQRRNADYYMDVQLNVSQGKYYVQVSKEIITFIEAYPLRKR